MSDKRVHIGKGIQRALDVDGITPLPDMFIVTDANGEQEYVDAATVMSILGVIGGPTAASSPDVLIDCGTITAPSDNVLIDCGTIL